jgi:hypothetical protein
MSLTGASVALGKLREPFPPDQVGKLPKAGLQLDYVGHGAVRARLLDVDPEWTWEPCATDDRGYPVLDYDGGGNPVGLWIRLTVCGVTRPGFGSCKADQFEAEKVLIGDALRNAAMSFGVALDLWIKGHAEDDEQVAAADTRTRSSGRSSKRSGPPQCEVCKEPATDGVRRHGDGYVHVKCLEAGEGEGAF